MAVVFAARTDFEFGLPRRPPRNDMNGDPDCHCEASAHTGCGNLRASESVQTRSFVLSAAARSARRVVCAAVREERALRMRRTPCGCVPYESSTEVAP